MIFLDLIFGPKLCSSHLQKLWAAQSQENEMKSACKCWYSMPDLCVGERDHVSLQSWALSMTWTSYWYKNTYLVLVLKVHAFGHENPGISHSLESFGGNILAVWTSKGLHGTSELFAPTCNCCYLIDSFTTFDLLRFQGKFYFWIPEKSAIVFYLQLILFKMSHEQYSWANTE